MNNNRIHRDSTHVEAYARMHSNVCEPGDKIIFHKRPSGWTGYNVTTGQKFHEFISNMRCGDFFTVIRQYHKDIDMFY